MVTSDRRLGSYRSSCHQRVWPFWIGGWQRPAAAGTRAAGAGLVGRQGSSRRIASATAGSLATATYTLSTCQFTKRLSAQRQPPPWDRVKSVSRFARQTGAICLAVAWKNSQTQVAVAIGQAVSKRNGLQRGHGHALHIHRVEAADCVAHHQQPRWELAHLVIASPRAGRVTLRRHRTERLGSPQCSDQRRLARNRAADSSAPRRSMRAVNDDDLFTLTIVPEQLNPITSRAGTMTPRSRYPHSIRLELPCPHRIIRITPPACRWFSRPGWNDG
jgi:hypothetical protein